MRPVESNPQSQPAVTVLVPVKGIEAHLADTVAQVQTSLGATCEIICIFDSWNDRNEARLPNGVTLTVSNEPGFGKAVAHGFRMARAPVVAVTMADGSDQVEQLPHLLMHGKDGRTIVVPSRYTRGGSRVGGSAIKAFLSRSAAFLARPALPEPVRDPTNNFRLYPRWLSERMSIESSGFSVALELLVKGSWAGCRIVEVPTNWKERSSGKSNFRMAQHALSYLWWIGYGLIRRIRDSQSR